MTATDSTKACTYSRDKPSFHAMTRQKIHKNMMVGMKFNPLNFQLLRKLAATKGAGEIPLVSCSFQIWPEEGVGGLTAGTDDAGSGGGVFSLLLGARLSQVCHRRFRPGRQDPVKIRHFSDCK